MAGEETFQGERKASCPAAAATQVRTGIGRICRLLVQAGTGTIDVYDNTATAGTPVWSIGAAAVGAIYVLDCPMATGIRVVTGVGTVVTAVYSGD